MKPEKKERGGRTARGEEERRPAEWGKEERERRPGRADEIGG